MKQGFVYTRWLLMMTFFSLMGLLAVGMMTVHSKRTIRTIAVELNEKESTLSDLARRQDILDTDLASSLNPEYLKHLVDISQLDLGPPEENKIILVRPEDLRRSPQMDPDHSINAEEYGTRIELANNERGDDD